MHARMMDPAARHKRTKRGGAAAAAAAAPCPLPEELVDEILYRLPARSLHRFQCLSRRFHALISSPAFQGAHLRLSAHRRSLLLIKPPPPVAARRGGGGPSVYAFQLPSGPVERLTRRRLPQGPVALVTAAVAPCRGVVLLSCLAYDLHYVWNPSTSELTALPERTPLLSPARSTYVPSLAMFYGLGFCSRYRRHKVVRIYGARDHGGYASTTAICEVFAVNESAFWRPSAPALWDPIFEIRCAYCISP
ncbi:hypothetical protein ACP4OV_010972 [Aristida adscensionis]